MNSLKGPLMYMIRSWAAPANGKLRLLFSRKGSGGEGSCFEVLV